MSQRAHSITGDEDLNSCIRNCTLPFSQLPFDDVDSLVLSSLSYLNFSSYPLEEVTTQDRIPLIDILRFSGFSDLTCGTWLKEGDDVEAFLIAVATSVRYRDLSISFFAQEDSPRIDKQFSAVTFFAADMPPYIAFRGTDGSVSGWKEDFDIAYKDVIPSYTAALRYLSGVLSTLPRSIHVNVGGHSKGGHLAEYSAACIDINGFMRIDHIYNHDGPSFLKEPSVRFNGVDYNKKLHKTIPESSIFGMVLERRDNYRVVRSKASTVFQHRPLTWLSSNHRFSYVETIEGKARLFDETLDTWLRSSAPEQREIFLTTVFNLVKSTDATSWDEFSSSLGNARILLKTSTEIDDATREIIIEVIMRLLTNVRTQAAGYFSQRLSQMFERAPLVGSVKNDER